MLWGTFVFRQDSAPPYFNESDYETGDDYFYFSDDYDDEEEEENDDDDYDGVEWRLLYPDILHHLCINVHTFH